MLRVGHRALLGYSPDSLQGNVNLKWLQLTCLLTPGFQFVGSGMKYLLRNLKASEGLGVKGKKGLKKLTRRAEEIGTDTHFNKGSQFLIWIQKIVSPREQWIWNFHFHFIIAQPSLELLDITSASNDCRTLTGEFLTRLFLSRGSRKKSYFHPGYLMYICCKRSQVKLNWEDP